MDAMKPELMSQCGIMFVFRVVCEAVVATQSRVKRAVQPMQQLGGGVCS